MTAIRKHIGKLTEMILLLLIGVILPSCGPDWTTYYRGVKISGDDCDESQAEIVSKAQSGIDRALDYYGLADFQSNIHFDDTGFLRGMCQTLIYSQIPQFCERFPYEGPTTLILCEHRYWKQLYSYEDMVATDTAVWVDWVLAGKPRDGLLWDSICRRSPFFLDNGLQCVVEDEGFYALKCASEAAACGYALRY